ncbi:MAG: metal ABC transporter substrate-binding protein [Nitrospirota bacterium]
MPFVLFLLVSPAVRAQEPIRVVTTLPMLKEFVEQIGGPHVEVTSLLTGLENEHTYTPKPSDLEAVSRARLFVQVGVGLEIWAEPMLRAAKRPGLTVVTSSQGIPLIRDPEPGNNHEPHASSFGNPHVWLDPVNAKTMIHTIAKAMIAAAPAHRAAFLANQARYLKEIDAVQAAIQEQVKRLGDRRIVTHHNAWPYFARRFGFKIEGVILEQPGGEASAKTLASLTKLIQQKGIKVIVMEPQMNPKLPRMLAEETGATVVTLTPVTMPGGPPGTERYLGMLEYNARALIGALASP